MGQKHGQLDYRAKQLFEALYPQRIGSLDAISTLPKQFRTALDEEGLEVRRPAIEKTFRSTDGTIRYLVAMPDGETVETVWMPEGDGGEAGDGSSAGDTDWDRATICVSSQVGCAVNCQFCLTAALGVKRGRKTEQAVHGTTNQAGNTDGRAVPISVTGAAAVTGLSAVAFGHPNRFHGFAVRHGNQITDSPIGRPKSFLNRGPADFQTFFVKSCS